MALDTPSLYLVTPPIADPTAFLPLLEDAMSGAGAAAVLVRLAPADDRTLVERLKAVAAVVHRKDAAVIVADPGGQADLARIIARAGADGAHLSDLARLPELRRELEGRSLGAGALRSRHDAMTAGELGVDYVLFGEPKLDGSTPPLEAVAERAGWWSKIFQIPCVAYAPTLAAIPVLAGTGCEFVAVGEAFWDDPDGIEPALRRVRGMLAGAEGQPA